MKRIFIFGMMLFVGTLSTAVSASIVSYAAVLNGANEAAPNNSPATGTALVNIDASAHTMQVQFTFSNLVEPNTAIHIHCCTVNAGAGNSGVATMTPTFVGAPNGVQSGSYDQTFDMTLAASYNAAFVTANGGIAAAETALFTGIEADKAYLNIHSTFSPSGEIRGFLQPVPIPAAVWLLGSGLAGLLALGKRKSV